MADKVVSTSSKAGAFLEKNVKLLVGIIVVLLIFVGIAVLGSSLNRKSVEKALSEIDSIEYTFKKGIDDLSAEDLTARQDKALEDLEVLSAKDGITGVRANMLKAEILFEKNDFENSRLAWVKAADSKKSAYTASICYYNAAVCSENLNDLEGAVNYYTKSVKNEEFYLIDHAYFSLGRVNESKGDVEAALAAYQKINDIHPSSSWASVAKTRIIAINAAK